MDIYFKKRFDQIEPPSIFNENGNSLKFTARIKSIQFGDDSSYIHLELTEASTSHRKSLTLGDMLIIREEGDLKDWNKEIMEAIYKYSSDEFDSTTGLTDSLVPSKLVGEIFKFVFTRVDKSDDWNLFNMSKSNESYNISDLVMYQGTIASVSASFHTIEIVFKLALSKIALSSYLGDLHRVYHYDFQNEDQNELFLNTFDKFIWFDTDFKTLRFSNDNLMIIEPRKKVSYLNEFIIFDEHQVRPIQVCKLNLEDE